MADKLQKFIEGKKGCALLAWLHHFDKNSDGKIDYEEFRCALTEMEFHGDIQNLFNEIDCDSSGVLTLSEIDSWSADLWNSFRRWCASTFASAEDMMLKLSRGHSGRRSSGIGIPSSVPTTVHIRPEHGGSVSLVEFAENAVRLGWHGGFERVLFGALDSKNVCSIQAHDVPWFDAERAKQHRRAAQRGPLECGGTLSQLQTRNKANAIRALLSFSALLRSKYGSLFGAWRKILDRDGSMQVQRKELFKACQDVGWYGDTVALWHAIDQDESGQTTLDEFSPSEARQLAVFKRWAEQRCGGMKGVLRSVSLASHNKAKVALDEDAWVVGCQKLGVPGNAKQLFNLLDWEGQDKITYKELKCLDKWMPCEWLTADPSEEAAQTFVNSMLFKYGHALKAWRIGIDRDSSGKANWKEFKLACDRIGFKGNVAGAWLVLDGNQTGYITIHDIDKAAAESLADFRRWAQNEFGGVMLAFKALDTDESGSLTFKEFKKSVKNYGFRGDVNVLFNSFNMDRDEVIGRNEVAFLDEWEMEVAGREIPPAYLELRASPIPAGDVSSSHAGAAGRGRGLQGGSGRRVLPSSGSNTEELQAPPSPQAHAGGRAGVLELPGGGRFLQLSAWDGPVSARHLRSVPRKGSSSPTAWSRPASVAASLKPGRAPGILPVGRGSRRPSSRPVSCFGGVAYMPCAAQIGLRDLARPLSRGTR